MIIINKKQIIIVALIILLFIFLFLTIKVIKRKEIVTSANLLGVKRVVLDAGHGFPDERCI